MLEFTFRHRHKHVVLDFLGVGLGGHLHPKFLLGMQDMVKRWILVTKLLHARSININKQLLNEVE